MNQTYTKTNRLRAAVATVLALVILTQPTVTNADSVSTADSVLPDVSTTISFTGNTFTSLLAAPTTTPPVIDDRAARIDAYFAKYNMPLVGYGQAFVTAADQCGMDWRLLPAIAVRESSGGKHLMNNNPFGWGSAKIPFTSFTEAIQVVGQNLCGNNPATSQYYQNTTTYQKLWYYNGTVMPSYPDEVIAIMNSI